MTRCLRASDSPDFQQELVEVLPHLRAFARSLTRHRERADDLVNDAVVRALAAAHQYEPNTNFRAWMFTILRNLYYNEGRKNRTTIPFEDVESFLHAVPPNQQVALEFCDFRRAFWQLGDDHREVLILVGASGLGYEEAAKICGCAVGTIKSRVSRARSELTRLMSEDALAAARTDLAPVSGRDAVDLLEMAVEPA